MSWPVVAEGKRGPGLRVRAAWFVVAWFLVAPVPTLPLGLMLYNRVPFAASLYRY